MSKLWFIRNEKLGYMCNSDIAGIHTRFNVPMWSHDLREVKPERYQTVSNRLSMTKCPCCGMTINRSGSETWEIVSMSRIDYDIKIATMMVHLE